MDIFKLNYQLRGDFHNFLDVIGSNWCGDAKTNRGPYSVSALSVTCYNIWGSEAEVTGAGRVIDVWLAQSFTERDSPPLHLSLDPPHHTLKSANIWMLIADEQITCRLLMWYCAPYFYPRCVLKLIKFYGWDGDHWNCRTIDTDPIISFLKFNSFIIQIETLWAIGVCCNPFPLWILSSLGNKSGFDYLGWH